MIHLGDITKINGAKIPIVDVVTGGSPCQDLSVAGKRAGLEGERSGLFMEQIRVIKEMRENERKSGRPDRLVRPRFMVWENVPGTFSSNKGEDFRAVLEETIRIVEPNANVPQPPKEGWHKSGAIVGDGWSIAWRIHDAQFWGVPQRRKRLCLLADFNGESAPRILFDPQLRRTTEDSESYETLTYNRRESESEIQTECESLSGDSEQSCQQGQGITEGIERSIGDSITYGIEPGAAQRLEPENRISKELSPTLRSNMGDNHASVVQVEMEVSVRKYEVDKTRLIECLQTHRKYKPQEVADKLGVPKTMVEHWFRKDSCFSIPEPEIWPKLKALLDIETDEFDDAIMTFEIKGGNYDTRNRIHVGDVAPTLSTQSKNTLHEVAVVIPLEGNGTRESHKGPGYGNKDDPCFTLNAVEHHSVMAVDARNNCEYEINGSLQSRAANIINANNVIRTNTNS